MIVTPSVPFYECGIPWASMSVALLGEFLCRSFGHLYDCDTSWDLSLIVALLGPLYDCDTSCAFL